MQHLRQVTIHEEGTTQNREDVSVSLRERDHNWCNWHDQNCDARRGIYRVPKSFLNRKKRDKKT